jgi:hypothetical protein
MTQQAAGSTGSEELGVAVGENRDKWGLGGRRRNRTHSAPDREGIAGAVVEVAIVSMKMSRRRKEEEERETDLVLVGMMRTARLRLLASLSLDNSFIAVVGNSTPVSTPSYPCSPFAPLSSSSAASHLGLNPLTARLPSTRGDARQVTAPSAALATASFPLAASVSLSSCEG